VDVDPDDALASSARGGNKVQRCAAWLLDYLSTYAYPSDELVAAAGPLGFTFDNLKEAKARLKAEGKLSSSNRGRFQGQWWCGLGKPDAWTLRPDTPHTPNTPHSPHYGDEDTGTDGTTATHAHSGESGESGETRERGESGE
jgi:hypothetical protein